MRLEALDCWPQRLGFRAHDSGIIAVLSSQKALSATHYYVMGFCSFFGGGGQY